MIRLYTDSEGKRLLSEGHPDSAFFVGTGDPAEPFAHLKGLNAESDKADKPASNKADSPGANK